MSLKLVNGGPNKARELEKISGGPFVWHLRVRKRDSLKFLVNNTL